MSIDINQLKSEIKKSGASKGKILYFKEDEKVRVRFLQEIPDGIKIMFHDNFKLGINVPCQEAFGRECEYCEDDNLRTRAMYIWSVYDYASDEVKLLMGAVNSCSPVPTLLSLYETYGTITDRDYEILKRGSQTNTVYTVVPLKERKFRQTKIKALSEQAVLKYIDKAYPANNSELEDEDEEDKKPRNKKNKRTNKNNKNSLKGKMNEPEDEWEEEDEEINYNEMTARELYKLCKDRDIDCKPRNKADYYIELLKEYDSEQSEDDWEEEDEEEEDW